MKYEKQEERHELVKKVLKELKMEYSFDRASWNAAEVYNKIDEVITSWLSKRAKEFESIYPEIGARNILGLEKPEDPAFGGAGLCFGFAEQPEEPKQEWCWHCRYEESRKKWVVGENVKKLLDGSSNPSGDYFVMDDKWKFCPICGAKRPESKGKEYKYCQCHLRTVLSGICKECGKPVTYNSNKIDEKELSLEIPDKLEIDKNVLHSYDGNCHIQCAINKLIDYLSKRQ